MDVALLRARLKNKQSNQKHITVSDFPSVGNTWNGTFICNNVAVGTTFHFGVQIEEHAGGLCYGEKWVNGDISGAEPDRFWIAVELGSKKILGSYYTKALAIAQVTKGDYT